jgi:hypothetical protein
LWRSSCVSDTNLFAIIEMTPKLHLLMTFLLSGTHVKKACVEYTINDFEQAIILGETIGKPRSEQNRVQKNT